MMKSLTQLMIFSVIITNNIQIMLEKIIKNGLILGIIIKKEYSNTGIKFFSDENDSQQLGYMQRDKGYIIKPHRHNTIPREVTYTQEVLFIRSGALRVDFYDNNQVYFESRVLKTGDVILLANGGHGFEMLENSEIIEVKQGPYCGDNDKIRFEQVSYNKIVLK